MSVRVVQIGQKAPVTSQEEQKIDDQLAMKIKVNRAKSNAQHEIDTFKEVIQNTKSELEKLALFKDAAPILEQLMFGEYLALVEPIIKGNKPYGLSEVTYQELRQKYFKDLINQYEK